jgi:hypothetical protein
MYVGSDDREDGQALQQEIKNRIRPPLVTHHILTFRQNFLHLLLRGACVARRLRGARRRKGQQD